MFEPEELSILQDSDFLRKKQQVQQKIWKLLSDSRSQLRPMASSLQQQLPAGADCRHGKISKGEQYRQLPYLVLDFPRKFTQDDIFTFRTMVWWGHECSCTLHLQGHSAEKYRKTLARALPKSAQRKGLWVGVGETPWEYHFGETNYRPAEEFPQQSLAEHLLQHPFIKLSKQLSLTHAAQLPSFSKDVFELYIYLLGLQT